MLFLLIRKIIFLVQNELFLFSLLGCSYASQWSIYLTFNIFNILIIHFVSHFNQLTLTCCQYVDIYGLPGNLTLYLFNITRNSIFTPLPLRFLFRFPLYFLFFSKVSTAKKITRRGKCVLKDAGSSSSNDFDIFLILRMKKGESAF